MTNEHQLLDEPKRLWYQTRLVLFVGGSIVIAVLLVLVSMALYISSGAAQLDLSRPGYQSVQDKEAPSNTFKSFPSTGDVSTNTIDEFQRLYDEQVRQVTTVDAFDPAVLDNQALGIDAPGADQ